MQAPLPAAPAHEWALECVGAWKSFWEAEEPDQAKLRAWYRRRQKIRVDAVRDITLSVRRGEVLGILGQNGSGKSTLIRLISTLLLPDRGEIRVFGLDVVQDRYAVRRLINRVSVDAAFFKKLSAWENLSYAARLYGVAPRQAEPRVRGILTSLGFAQHKIYTPLENLSRGMQQKVAIARALLTSPVLLLLDEPTTGLDPKSKREVQQFVRAVQAEHEATILLTSHDMQEVERLCERVAILDRGRLVALGTIPELKARYLPEQPEADLEAVFFASTGKDFNDEEVTA